MRKFKKLIKKLELEKYVIFHGFKKRKDLDELFGKSDIGIGSLGNHRKGIYKESALKNREYCARGLPFILSSKDEDFPESFKYIHYVSQDETPIDIGKIIQFYNNIKDYNYLKKMREYAEKHLKWEVKLRPIIDKIY
ncbi:glycosyltransferase [Marinitoga lauensis]|uniref:glycosyltransferase n=1 Tax=Marinitoga lauensis TaxID=2201189 RepID=UPI001010C111